MPKNKQQLRVLVKNERQKIPKKHLDSIASKIMMQLIQSFTWKNKVVNLFLPIQKFNEIDLRPFVRNIQESGGQVSINRSDFNTYDMTPILWDRDLLIHENSYGIPEPVGGSMIEKNKIDFVLVPMLAFNTRGHRLGYGKGFYDRFLSKVSDSCITIGICHQDKPSAFEGIEKNDIALDYIVTPDKTWDFKELT